MAVITISRDLAMGGRRLGRMVAKRLGYQFVDKSLFQQIAEDLNVSEKTLESFEKSREYRISNIFARMFSKSYIERIVGHDKSVVEEEAYQESLRNLITAVANEGDVVIIGRAAYFFLKDMPDCYRFRLTASFEWRKNYAVSHLGKPRGRVADILRQADLNARWFRRSIGGDAVEDPNLVHLVLNMGLISFEKAADLILYTAGLA